MKKLTALLLALMMIFSAALAETAEETAEDVAYRAYQSLDNAYMESLKYLRELGRIWVLTMDLDKSEDANTGWLMNQYMSSSSGGEWVETLRIEYISWYLQNVSNSADDARREFFSFYTFYSRFIEPYIRPYDDSSQLVWILLKAEQDIGCLSGKEAVQASISSARQDISKLMKQYPEYPFTSELKAAYTDVTALHDYAYDFNDSYARYADKLERYEASYHSFDVNFDFIFD